MMTDLRGAIGRERRRMVQVRNAFEAGLATRAPEDAAQADFYLSCAAYIVFSLDRLHVQDQMIHDLLVERIPPGDREAHDRLAELNARHSRSRSQVEALQCAAAELLSTGPAGRRQFEQAGRQFILAMQGLAAPRRNPFESYTDTLFTAEDWTVIAAVTDESDRAEADLFGAVQRTAPQGIEPAMTKVVYH